MWQREACEAKRGMCGKERHVRQREACVQREACEAKRGM